MKLRFAKKISKNQHRYYIGRVCKANGMLLRRYMRSSVLKGFAVNFIGHTSNPEFEPLKSDLVKMLRDTTTIPWLPKMKKKTCGVSRSSACHK